MSDYLPKGYELIFPAQQVKYTIIDVIGRGATAIAYRAKDDSGREYLLKECFPRIQGIKRADSGEVECTDNALQKFEQRKAEFRASGNCQIKIRNFACNETPLACGILEGNNTLYIEVVPYEGETFDKYIGEPLCTKIKLCLAVAKLVSQYHKNDLLCLDIKPENIFVLKNSSEEVVTELVEYIDFDSVRQKDEISFGCSLSYTEAWAAPEQTNPYAYKKISEATDIYAVGELVFWCVFGRHSKDYEHRDYSEYPFDKVTGIEVKKVISRNAVQKILSELFHSTLRSAASNRFQSMDKVIECLDKLVQELERKIYIDSRVPNPTIGFVGRKSELAELSVKLKSENVVFVTGMGGIGKSTIVRNYCARNKFAYDTIIYLECVGSFIDAFIDDNQFSISNFTANRDESEKELYQRKLNQLKSATEGQRVLIVIDNYIGTINALHDFISDSSWKVIITTRTIPPTCSFEILPIKAISELQAQYQLFENNLGRRLEDNEMPLVDSIIKEVAGHTLVLELIAKQISGSYISLESAGELVKRNGFLHIANEAVDYVKDNKEIQGKVSSIISALFSACNLSEDSKLVLKMLSCFEPASVRLDMLQELLGVTTKDAFNALVKDSWAIIDDGKIKLHPVIAETVRLWGWTQAYKDAVNSIMKELFIRLTIEFKKEDYPKMLAEYIASAKKNPKEAQNLKRKCDKGGIAGELTYRRMLAFDDNGFTDFKKVNEILNLSEPLLRRVTNTEELTDSEWYIDLLYQTAIAMPCYREDFILNAANKLLKDSEKNLRNTVSTLRLIERIVVIYCERRDFDSALQKVDYANKRFSFLNSFYFASNYEKALLSDIKATYYDAKLDGFYDVQTEKQTKLLKALKESLNRAIHHMKHAKNPDSIFLLARYKLSLASVLMRSGKENSVKIDRLLDDANKIVDSNCLKYAELRWQYCICRAWYYTLTVPCQQKAQRFGLQAYVIASKTGITIVDNDTRATLDFIIQVMVPISNMLFESKQYHDSARWLQGAIHLCEKEIGIVPYIRTKMDLMEHLIDVYWEASDFDKCRETLIEIEKENAENKIWGVYKEISPELKEKIELA